jgi:hypothetical protein
VREQPGHTSLYLVSSGPDPLNSRRVGDKNLLVTDRSCTRCISEVRTPRCGIRTTRMLRDPASRLDSAFDIAATETVRMGISLKAGHRRGGKQKGHTPVPGRLSKRMVAKWRSVGGSQRDSRLLRGSALAGQNLIHRQAMPAGTTPWFDPVRVESSRNAIEGKCRLPAALSCVRSPQFCLAVRCAASRLHST